MFTLKSQNSKTVQTNQYNWDRKNITGTSGQLNKYAIMEALKQSKQDSNKFTLNNNFLFIFCFLSLFSLLWEWQRDARLRLVV